MGKILELFYHIFWHRYYSNGTKARLDAALNLPTTGQHCTTWNKEPGQINITVFKYVNGSSVIITKKLLKTAKKIFRRKQLCK